MSNRCDVCLQKGSTRPVFKDDLYYIECSNCGTYCTPLQSKINKRIGELKREAGHYIEGEAAIEQERSNVE